MAAAVASGHDFGDVLSHLEPMGHADQLHDDQAANELQQMVLGCNKEGMEYLRKGQYKQAFEQLKYAEAVLEAQGMGADEPSSLMAVTCNNLGCYYKKVGKLHAALSYLRKALKVELSLQTDDATVAGTHLNVCAILSKLEKHDKAVKHAECALQLISARVAASGDGALQEEQQLLAIAYHNVAVEQDYLHQWEAAAQAYQQGYQVAKHCLGEQHPLTQTLGKHCEAAVQKTQKFTRERPAPSALPPTEPRSRSTNRRPVDDASSPQLGDGGRTASPSPKTEPQSMLPDISGAGNLRITKDFAPQREALGGRSVLQGGASALPDASEWAQPDHMQQWRPAAPGQLPPLAAAPQPSYGHYGGGFAMASGLADLSGGFAAEPTWKMDPNPQVLASSFMDRLVQDVPAAAQFAAEPPEPPPLVYIAGAGASAAASSRQARMKAREMQQQQQVQQQTQQQKRDSEASRQPEEINSEDLRRRVPAVFAPAPPTSGRPMRPYRPGGAAARRAQREMAKVGGPLAPGSLAADTAPAGGLPGGLRPQQSQLLRRSAAEKIQRAWRQAHRSKKATVNNSQRMQEAATKIQARWRGFAVVRRRHNKGATEIQRWARGFLVRLKKCRLRAAIRIERHARGMLARRELRRLAAAATKIQTMARRKLAQRRVQARRRAFNDAASLLQRAWYRKKAYRVAAERRQIRDAGEARHAAATKVQKVVRGRFGRARFSKVKAAHEELEAQHRAATRIQCLARERLARAQVKELRKAKREKDDAAATTIRKYFLRFLHRKRYLNLKNEFSLHEDSVIIMQRYVRGFVVRSKMWKAAIRAEEELWAAVELQRLWRGYAGRLRWAREYEYVTSRERAARRLQRSLRGWLARCKLERIRQRRARAEFERARQRFLAAQRIQAVARGMLCRKRLCALLRRRRYSAIKIQSVFRGHRYRVNLYEQTVAKRTAQIQAAMRGFLVRNRRFHLLVRIVCIQSNYRKWLRWVPEEERRRRCEAWRAQRAAARAALAEEAAASER